MQTTTTLLFFCLVIALSVQQDILYQVEQSLDAGKTWQQRGTIQSAGNNQRTLSFTPSNNQQEWDSDLIQQMMERAKQKDVAQTYTIKLTNQHTSTSIQKVISLV